MQEALNALVAMFNGDDDNGFAINANPATLDAFGRQSTAEPYTLFDSKQLVTGSSVLFWDDQMTLGTGTTSVYNNNQSSTTLTVASNTIGKRVRQTFRRFNYQPGKAQEIFITGNFDGAQTGTVKACGYFDDENGLFLQLNNGVPQFVRRTYVTGTAVDNPVNQSSWNGDKMDGTGASGVTLDWTKTFIFFIDFEWLGVGSVRFGFVIGGQKIIAHQMTHTNILSNVYMTNPNLPLRYSIENLGYGPASTITTICSTVISSGGSQQLGSAFSVDRGVTGLATGNDTNIYPLLAVRLKSTHKFANVKFTDLSIVCTTTSPFRWCILLNPTVAGNALSFADVTNSAIQVANGATNATTVSGGTQLYSGYANQTGDGTLGANLQNQLRLGTAINGTSDILVVGVTRLSSQAETFFGNLGYVETY